MLRTSLSWGLLSPSWSHCVLCTLQRTPPGVPGESYFLSRVPWVLVPTRYTLRQPSLWSSTVLRTSLTVRRLSPSWSHCVLCTPQRTLKDGDGVSSLYNELSRTSTRFSTVLRTLETLETSSLCPQYFLKRRTCSCRNYHTQHQNPLCPCTFLQTAEGSTHPRVSLAETPLWIAPTLL